MVCVCLQRPKQLSFARNHTFPRLVAAAAAYLQFSRLSRQCQKRPDGCRMWNAIHTQMPDPANSLTWHIYRQCGGILDETCSAGEDAIWCVDRLARWSCQVLVLFQKGKRKTACGPWHAIAMLVLRSGFVNLAFLLKFICSFAEQSACTLLVECGHCYGYTRGIEPAVGSENGETCKIWTVNRMAPL